MSNPEMLISMSVHYVSHGTPVREDGTQAFPSACRAATITEVHPDSEEDAGPHRRRVGLHVVNPTGQFFHSILDGGSDHSQLGTPGSWHTIAECEIVHAQPTFGRPDL